ncbi:MAG: hypothetical protein HQK96_08110 [Nitrospirae bacterium]|nr:hypothetical protein [Nitrospirota bacterium]
MKERTSDGSVVCPKCRGQRVSTPDSRVTTFWGQECIRRRRVCSSCGFRWSTKELPAEFLDKLKESLDDMERVKKAIMVTLNDEDYLRKLEDARDIKEEFRSDNNKEPE